MWSAFLLISLKIWILHILKKLILYHIKSRSLHSHLHNNIHTLT